MDYLKLLEHSYAEMQKDECGCPPESRLEYLAEYIFGFITYDSSASMTLAEAAVAFVWAVTNRTTFKYMSEDGTNVNVTNRGRYRDYLIMANMPFFKDRLSWGGSIRGAWWEAEQLEAGIYTVESTGLFEGETQVLQLTFNDETWKAFMRAIVVFALPEMQNHDLVMVFHVGTDQEGKCS